MAGQFRRLIAAIRDGDDQSVESALVTLSQRSRWLAPLALVVGGLLMLFQGVKLLVTNWRLTLVQILPAMWIWVAMLDLKVHVLHGKSFRTWHGPLLIPLVLGTAAVTAASFYLNAVFAFSVSQSGRPEIGPAFVRARSHRWTILRWGFAVGLLLGFSAFVTARWGKAWFGLSLGIVVGIMMLAYVALPARLLGIRQESSTRDKLTASAVGGAIGAVVCSPPYALGRVAILMLGSHVLRYVGVLLLIVAIILQTGATSAVKAVKLSAKLVAGSAPDAEATTPVAAAGPAG